MQMNISVVVIATVVCLLTLEQVAPKTRVCPYRVHDWTVAGPVGEYGIIELGYLPGGRYPSAIHSIVLAGSLGECGLLRLAGRASILLVAALMFAFSRWRHLETVTPGGSGRHLGFSTSTFRVCVVWILAFGLGLLLMSWLAPW